MLMYALIGYVDGFGNDGYVKGIYCTYSETIRNADLHSELPDRYVEFDFGKVDFDYYEAKRFMNEKHTKKRKK